MQLPQSIFLFLAAALFGGTALLPFGYAQAVPDTVFADAILTMSDSIGLLILAAVAALLAFVAIFVRSIKYDKAIYAWQRRLAVFSMLAGLALMGLVAYYLFGTQAVAPSVGASIFFPLPAIILLYLSNRATNRDEALIKSSNRIRD